MLKALPPLTLFTAFMLAAYMYPIPAAAKTIRISLGSVVFTPDTVTAAVGDVLEFSFFPVNNSATMSDFDNPCTPAKDATGFHSGFFATASGQNKTSFQVEVTTKDPMFIYCGFRSHCQNGMTAVVNPSDSQTLEAYRLAAREVGRTIVPDGVFGGRLVAAREGSPSPPPPPPPPGGSGGGSGSGGPEVNAAVWVGGGLGVGGFVATVLMVMVAMMV